MTKKLEFRAFEKQHNTYDIDIIVCPYCGAVQQNSYHFSQEESGEEFTWECENPDCKKGFLITPTLSFITVRMDEDECEDDDRPL